MTVEKNETERERTEQAALASQYRAIGPAAILAALLCLKRQEQKAPLAVQKAA